MDTDSKQATANHLVEKIAAIALSLEEFEQTIKKLALDGFDCDLLQQIAEHADTICAGAMEVNEIATKAVSKNFCARFPDDKTETGNKVGIV